MFALWGCHEGSRLSRLREYPWTMTKSRMESWERTVWEARWVEDIRLKKIHMQKLEVWGNGLCPDSLVSSWAEVWTLVEPGGDNSPTWNSRHFLISPEPLAPVKVTTPTTLPHRKSMVGVRETMSQASDLQAIILPSYLATAHHKRGCLGPPCSLTLSLFPPSLGHGRSLSLSSLSLLSPCLSIIKL
jgi:hypothetical protein